MSLGRISSPSMPSSSTTDRRRLSLRRRGSISAPDPWGTFEETTRGVASVLHIIKASSPAPDDVEKSYQRKSAHGLGNPRTQSASSRISFASGVRPPSPHSDSDLGPRRSNAYTARASLTPAQVLELAQQCNNPCDSPKSPGGPRAPSTVHFTPIPDEHYLPFIDRASEVQELISSPSSRACKLFLLLAQTFPKDALPGTEDPKTWTYAQLEEWLVKTSREEANDTEWVRKAHLCIANKSDFIWERIKAALGVPPELEDFGVGIIGPNMSKGEDAEAVDLEEYDDDIWIEPIVPSPLPSRAISPFSPGIALSGLPSPSNRHGLELILEDEPDPMNAPPKSPIGLKIVNAPSPPPTRRFSASSNSRGTSSQLHGHYDALSERGSGHPLFPSNFRNVTLSPTLRANTRSPPVLPASRPPVPIPGVQRSGRVRSWADGWDPLRQEYAVSVGSASSIGR
ncbi:hypothetical protein M422DRAFT_29384 [Sphaerobolus stellatus SS14]|uniref:Unplaced genomic scaffold SPHSTscaffold_33, whole genome shotgun sequence n=1 Tax=Sphaerobolus stellatus (strain SS14) TaxID=990650 RepID=A0A0C9W4F1_SPHS4|nr:hypothetical protein M422DRAFT_29384 [Sphaerobolus stellatus SS14]